MMKPLSSIHQVYQLLVQEGKQRSLSTMTQVNNNATAFNCSEMIMHNDHSVMAVQHRPPPTNFSQSTQQHRPSSRRSVTGYLIHFGHSPISWKSKKQSTISKSSSEAEYRAMSQAATEITWLIRLLEELGVHNLKPVTLHCDNQPAIHIGKNPVFHEHTKHIDIDRHYSRQSHGRFTRAHTCIALQ